MCFYFNFLLLCEIQHFALKVFETYKLVYRCQKTEIAPVERIWSLVLFAELCLEWGPSSVVIEWWTVKAEAWYWFKPHISSLLDHENFNRGHFLSIPQAFYLDLLIWQNREEEE